MNRYIYDDDQRRIRADFQHDATYLGWDDYIWRGDLLTRTEAWATQGLLVGRIDYVYDSLARLEKQSVDANNDGSADQWKLYGYDESGWLSQLEYYYYGSWESTTTHAYDQAGRETKQLRWDHTGDSGLWRWINDCPAQGRPYFTATPNRPRPQPQTPQAGPETTT